MSRDHLIKSLTPIYLGRIASFVLETQNSTAADVENKIELLCLEYENLKSYLIERWRA
jgi:glucosylglycerate synthase